jgi:hypothetical protein
VLTVALSALVSSLVAWVTSRRTIVVEREKARLTAEQRHLEVLVNARLKEYPSLYKLLSDLPKAFDAQPTVTIDIASLLAQFNQWDSQHSILMSINTANCCDRMRSALVKAVAEGRAPSKGDQFHDLRGIAQDLELALKSDLGIHGIAIATEAGEKVLAARPVTSY